MGTKNTVDTQALRYLNCVRPILTRQQFLTLRGQITRRHKRRSTRIRTPDKRKGGAA